MKHKKQHDVRAASFKRIAVELISHARRHRELDTDKVRAKLMNDLLREVAYALNNESRLLRQLR